MNARSCQDRRSDEPPQTPLDLGWSGWWQVAKRVWNQIGEDNLGLVSAGVAFYAFLGLVPVLSALVSLWGLFSSPEQVEAQLGILQRVLPQAAYELVGEQLSRVAAGSSQALGWGLALSLLLTLWSAKRGLQAIVQATNLAYGQKETRGWFKMSILALGFTFGSLILILLVVGAIVVAPLLFGYVGFGHTAHVVMDVARYPLVAAVLVGALTVLYKLSPNRENPEWRWVFPGALLATLGWLLVSTGFSYYVANFGSYNETYGALGAVVVLMLWIWLSTFVILLGAEVNSEAEARTRLEARDAGDLADPR